MRSPKALDRAREKQERIHTLALGDGDPLANAPADPDLLFSLEEIAILLKPLMGVDAPRDDDGRILEVRPKGHWFEFEDIIEARWNEKARSRVCDIRYLIALAPPPDHKVTVLVLATGAEINNIFGVSPTKTIKYQLGISNKWRETHAGQILVSGMVFSA